MYYVKKLLYTFLNYEIAGLLEGIKYGLSLGKR